MEPQQEHQSYHADVSARRVARVYAEALYGAAQAAGNVQEVLEDFLGLLREVFVREPKLEVLLSSAAIGRNSRDVVIQKVFQGRVTDTFYHFLLVLNEHERLELLRTIGNEMRDIYDEVNKQVRVFATSAVPLDEEQVKQIGARVRQGLDLEPVVVNRVDPTILGGVILRVRDWQFDGSVRTKLNNIRNQILTRSSHEIQSRRDRFSSANGN